MPQPASSTYQLQLIGRPSNISRDQAHVFALQGVLLNFTALSE